jgi:hypothetical protein
VQGLIINVKDAIITESDYAGSVTARKEGFK